MAEKSLFKVSLILPSKMDPLSRYAPMQWYSFLCYSLYYIVLSCLVHLFLLLTYKFNIYNHFSLYIFIPPIIH